MIQEVNKKSHKQKIKKINPDQSPNKKVQTKQDNFT